MTVTVEVLPEYEAITVLFNGVLHLWIERPKLLGLQSWRDHHGKHVIEFAMVGGSITAEYDSREKWLAVLAGLRGVLNPERAPCQP